MRHLIILFIVVLAFACKENNPEQAAAEAAEVYSLLGLEYYAPTEPNSRLDSNLAVAQKNFDADASEENYIWLGRRLAYKVKYNQAIDVFTKGLEEYPKSYKLYRHRGHRYLSQRKFDAAISDFTQAVELMPATPLELEPDGIPNKINKPLSTTQFNVWYHLGLAYYLKGDFEKAEQAYLKCLDVSDNDDLVTATVDWLYMTYRRQGKTDAAKLLLEKITPNMTIVENDSYFKRLNLYKGSLPVDSVLNVSSTSADADLAIATQGYGVGNWYLYNGDTVQAISVFERVVGGKHFSAFGFIAAEADLARIRE